MHYYGYVFQDRGMPDFWCVRFPDFDMAVSQGASLAEAMENGREVLGYAIDAFIEQGKELPRPTSAEGVIKLALADPDFMESGANPPVIYAANIPSRDPRPARVNISLTHGQLADIDARARELGLTRSALMVKGALAYGE